jgi:hypothetical protein
MQYPNRKLLKLIKIFYHNPSNKEQEHAKKPNELAYPNDVFLSIQHPNVSSGCHLGRCSADADSKISDDNYCWR